MPPKIGTDPLPPFEGGKPASARRMNDGEAQAITHVTVGPGMTMRRVGGLLALGIKAPPPRQPQEMYTVRVGEPIEDGHGRYNGSLISKGVYAFGEGEEKPLIAETNLTGGTAEDISCEVWDFSQISQNASTPDEDPRPLDGLITNGRYLCMTIPESEEDDPLPVIGINSYAMDWRIHDGWLEVTYVPNPTDVEGESQWVQKMQLLLACTTPTPTPSPPP